jgi:hypothetical protein
VERQFCAHAMVVSITQNMRPHGLTCMTSRMHAAIGVVLTCTVHDRHVPVCAAVHETAPTRILCLISWLPFLYPFAPRSPPSRGKGCRWQEEARRGGRGQGCRRARPGGGHLWRWCQQLRAGGTQAARVCDG